MNRKTALILPSLLLIALNAFIFALAPSSQQPDRQSINPILGDLSFVQTYGHAPDASTDENTRIRTHLAYVETRLRATDVMSLSASQRVQRNHVLDLLHDYWTAGVFPRNYDHPGERRPCFIDRDGRICAVGYLVEQTAGREAAEAINQQHQYDDLLAMNDPALDNWVAGSGLSKVECAMIQPTYGWNDPTNNYVSPGLSAATAGFTGLNLSVNLINGVQLLKGNQLRVIPVVGLVGGVSQLALGAFMLPGHPVDNFGPAFAERQHLLSMMNIGLGTTTILTSAYNLIVNRKPQEKKLSWNIYGYPTGSQNMAMGFALNKRF
jgi:hypothetical protein